MRFFFRSSSSASLYESGADDQREKRIICNKRRYRASFVCARGTWCAVPARCVSRDPRSSVLGRAGAVERRGSAHQKPHSDRVTGSTVEDSVGPRNVTPVTAARQDPRPAAAESCRRPAEDGTLRLLGLLVLLSPEKKSQEVIIRACLNV